MIGSSGGMSSSSSPPPVPDVVEAAAVVAAGCVEADEELRLAPVRPANAASGFENAERNELPVEREDDAAAAGVAAAGGAAAFEPSIGSRGGMSSMSSRDTPAVALDIAVAGRAPEAAAGRAVAAATFAAGIAARHNTQRGIICI